MTSGEFHSHILKIVKRCQFPNQEAEERAVRDAIFMGMNSQRARDKAKSHEWGGKRGHSGISNESSGS